MDTTGREVAASGFVFIFFYSRGWLGYSRVTIYSIYLLLVEIKCLLLYLKPFVVGHFSALRRFHTFPHKPTKIILLDVQIS